ncbi:MAG: arsenical pump-driving ATPase [Bdellovibrionaceae bacterium]|nr:arsenical pump-driving ATPase [Pseudobdellovibrionaceae bacterium]MBX3033778.1 arsenical pump-driving ATPase [Pseudobdellovibrionaceae bacterium]
MTEEIHFVTGKGGVGKSVVAASLALKEARRGRKTLLVELGERSFYKDFFSLGREVGYAPVQIAENLDLALWSGRDSLREYAHHLLKVEALVKLLFENSVSRSLIDIAPALPELAILGKATSGPRRHGPPAPHQVLIIDAFATGHFLALLQAPRGMAEAVRFGPMGEQSRAIEAVLTDPKVTRVHVVSLPEEMPVKESEELTEALTTRFGLRPDIILNKTIDLAGVSDRALNTPHPFAVHMKDVKDRQNEMRDRLLKTGCPLREAPLILSDDPWALTGKIAEVL